MIPISAALGEQQPIFEKQPLDNSQNGPFGIHYIPKWYMDAMVAAQCYATGMDYITSDPKMAVEAFELGLNYARKAAAAGAGEQIESLSLGLSKELKIAQANLANLKNKSSDNSSGKNNDSANNNNNDQGQTLTRTTSPRNNGVTIKTSGSPTHLGGSQSAGTGRTRGF